eukprot:614731-Prorocentrum_minimum.AAC.1
MGQPFGLLVAGQGDIVDVKGNHVDVKGDNVDVKGDHFGMPVPEAGREEASATGMSFLPALPAPPAPPLPEAAPLALALLPAAFFLPPPAAPFLRFCGAHAQGTGLRRLLRRPGFVRFRPWRGRAAQGTGHTQFGSARPRRLHLSELC